MEGGTLQDWKLYRQFQKTLDAIKIDTDDLYINDELANKWHINAGLPSNNDDDDLELKEIEDEGEQLGGRENHALMDQFSAKMELKSYFDQWRDLVDLAAKQRRKAEFYHRFTTLEKGFKAWKSFVKHEKDKRERKKWFKAVGFDEMRIQRYSFPIKDKYDKSFHPLLAPPLIMRKTAKMRLLPL